MYAGNAVVVNLLMRFPALIPFAIGAGIVAVFPSDIPPVELPPTAVSIPSITVVEELPVIVPAIEVVKPLPPVTKPLPANVKPRG